MTINLKGYIVANGATDWDVDVWPAMPELFKYFNLIPDKVFKDYNHVKCEKFFNGTIIYDSDFGTV
jgi:hypothetical protein